jgi:hypothetical protein
MRRLDFSEMNWVAADTAAVSSFKFQVSSLNGVQGRRGALWGLAFGLK